MAKREFLMLAAKYHGQDVTSWFWSQKLDGIRAFWDGGISRGKKKTDIPWANSLKDHWSWTEDRATGLWSRYGKIIFAPDWWLDALPPIPLDGELMSGILQDNMSIVRKRESNSEEWRPVTYNVFESPSLRTVFANGKMDNIHYKKTFNGILQWIGLDLPTQTRNARDTFYFLDSLEGNDVLKVVPQTRIRTIQSVRDEFERITSEGGEGMMLRHPASYYSCDRTQMLLKWKDKDDAEGVVMGYTWGKLTDKDSKHLGRMGSLRVKWNGKEFDLSGFTDVERTMSIVDITRPGEVVSKEVNNPNFPRGSRVTFTYRGLTSDGLPREARYLRMRDDMFTT